MTIESTLRARRDAGHKLLVPYVTGGLGRDWVDVVRAVAAAGADAIEIGIPFSDPLMDGPVVQEATRQALELGATPVGVVGALGAVDAGVPLAVMTAYNIVFRAGHERFARTLTANGVRGAILPDLPVDEAEEWRSACTQHGVATVFLAAPGTDAGRLKLVAEASTGFVYCVSTYGVTGERTALSEEARHLVGSLRRLTDRPLLVGVGIGTPEQAASACQFADGVIVGTALVRKLLEDGPEACLRLAVEFRSAIPHDV